MIDRFRRAWQDPASQARILRWFWIISTVFMLFGFVVMLLLLLQAR